MRTLLNILFFVISFQASCQKSIPVDFSTNGWKYNAAVVSEIFLSLYGEKQLETWLYSNKIIRNRINIQLNFDVDCYGRVLRVRPLPSAKKFLSEKQLLELHTYFQRKQVYFHFWYYYDPELGTIDIQRRRASEEISKTVKKNGHFTIYVPFNRSLVEDYVYSKKYPTYVSYLKDQIKEYKK